ncbi:MAG: 16S rRNA (cytosine(1402)-N(4))-methyltransferase RsmH [Acutalibacteraceae bacterium]|nr:16S rRNA (cytosine(1402)-N(4))-methyltransferase RsmH [Clostridia bacterium]MEE3449318.1 16S rRNA (cytosine(1402)-N(4))-methyltransferase RsmH [Acutalibacteraceae bacterium]
MEFVHKSVLLNESIEGLNIKPDGIYVDGTAGGGGHSFEIAKRLSENGRLIAIDQDPDAIKAASQRLKDFQNVTIVRNNFSNIKEVLFELGVDSVDGVLLDIGVSSWQLDSPERGFSYHYDAPLDMRMSREGISAYDIVNESTPQELLSILTQYGEEKFAKNIVRSIIKARETAPVKTTTELAELVKNAYPAKARQKGHPARKTFQALRIAVNGELDVLREGLDNAFDVLNVNGRLAVITFHSLEDGIVKQTMKKWCEGCTCPPEFPVCVCGKKPKAELVNRRPIEPSQTELEQNNRARSARLRICKKLKNC